ncbi:helix-turn-helix transcriptional regulator [Streptomyces triculaminicus]|uniref:helix-turn-helix domain-containing protein n=1 Tax=Streptomyces triculaminicus TaxID=2816232 RepID=UPI00340DA18F
MGASDLAEALRSLKERSGLSYGVLAKRLHVSTSTLHRYCNGSTVPTEFAPVERLARLCKATPEELLQVHRLWILADATRGRKSRADGASADATQPEPTAPVDPEPAAPAEETATAPAPDVAAAPPGPAGTRSSGPTPRASSAGRPRRERRFRKAVLAALAVTCVMGSTALAVSLADGDDDKRTRRPGASSSRGAEAARPGRPGTSPVATPSSSPGEEEGKESGEPAASAGPDGTMSPSSAGKQDGADDKGGADQGDVPLTVHTRPYAYESPCSQSYLVNRGPDQMPKPPFEQDAPAWVSELGAVSADNQFVKITLQGTGTSTVVLEELHVRVDSTNAPLAWNTYATGVGCGGDVATRSFGVDLDAGSPALTPIAGQRAFPYKVSRTDPEVFYVKADAKQHDVRWHLEVQWSSGGRRGVFRIDDQGRPFRTSGSTGRPSYQQPLGDTRWSPAPQG